MYKKRYQSWRKHFDFLLLDLFCLHLSYLFSYLIIFHGQNPYGNTFYNNALFVVTLIDGAVIVFYQTFRNVIQRDLFKEISITVKHSIIVALLSIISIYITDTTNYYNRYLLLLMFVFYVVITFIVRCLWKLFLTKRATNGGKRKLFIVTTESMMETVLDNIRNKNYQRYNIVGISVIDKDLKGEYIDGVKIVANSDDVYEFVCKNWVDEVFINLDQEQPYPTYLVDMFEEMGVITHLKLFNENNTLGRKQFVEHMAGYTVLTTTINYASPFQLLVKRLIDIVVGIIGCVLTGIVTLIIGPLIKKADPGPIFFVQERVGENGKTFKMYKFRSMYMDAEERKKELEEHNKVGDGLMFKMDEDPRIIGFEKLPDGTTKRGIGNILRDTSLDEFPQFLNVLKGDMSLIGTRPPTVNVVQKYELHHRARLSTKPGITGLWQVSGRSDITDFEEVVKLDTQYIQNWSLGYDIKIILKTIKVILKREGSM